MTTPIRRNSRGPDTTPQNETPPARLPRRTTGGTPTPLTPLQEGAERVKVVVRVRPPNATETAGGVEISDDSSSITLQRKHANVAQTDFAVDKVLGPEATQEDVYEAAVRPIVEDVMRGYNGTIMAYGQTGAGKTYTLSSVSSAGNIGMMPRAASNIFNEIAADPAHTYNVVMSYVQIYMELIQDLLKPSNENLQIREGGNGVFVAGVEEQPVRSMADCLRLMQLGEQNRKVAFTHLNAHSSRSHAIIMLTVVKRRRFPGSNPIAAPDEEKMKVGKLFIVDLAGSERLKKSQSTGLRATEAKAINLSLTTLGICINSRADRTSKHTPFRDSKLTRLLQESLGGNAKTSLVVAVANAVEHADETLQSLQFGSRAMHVQTKAVVNESLGSKLLNADLLAKLANAELMTPCLVDASLLAKEEELDRIQQALQGEKDRAARMIAEMRAEKETETAMKDQELNAAQAEISQRLQEAERHSSKLQEAAARMGTMEASHRRQLAELQQRLEESELSLVQMAEQVAMEEGKRDAILQQARRENAAELVITFPDTLSLSPEERLRVDHSQALQEAASSPKKALADALAQIQSLAQANLDALNQQKLAHVRDMEQNTSTHRQTHDSLLQKIADAESDAAQAAEFHSAELAARDQAHGESIRGLGSELEAIRAERDSLKAALADAQRQVGGLESQAKASEAALRHRMEHAQAVHQEELAAQEGAHREVVCDLEAQLEDVVAEKDTELNGKSSEYCRQLAAVAIDHQKAVDAFHAQIRSSESRAQQVQEAMKAEHAQRLMEADQSYQAGLAQVQRQLAQAEEARESLAAQMVQQKEEWQATQDFREEEWAQRMEATEAAAAERLASEVERGRAQMAEVEGSRDLSTAHIADLQSELDSLQRQHAALADEHSTSGSEARALKASLEGAEGQVRQYKEQMAETEKRLAAVESRNEQLQSLWSSNKRVGWAARVIQKHYKAWRLRNLKNQTSKDRHALAMAQSDHSKLEGRNAAMQQTAHQQNLWAGQQMVADSLVVLEDAVQQIRAAFLMPSKELKRYTNLKARMSLSPAFGGPRTGNLYTPSPLSRSLSFVSNSSGQSFISKAANQEGPLQASSSLKQSASSKQPGGAGVTNIQAHWGS